MPNRQTSSGDGDYRFGFQGQEKDSEISGTEGGHLAFKYRIYDTRLGRFLSVDPLSPEYPYWSSYHFAGNNVIRYIELEGAELAPVPLIDGPVDYRPKIKIPNELTVYTESIGLVLPEPSKPSLIKKALGLRVTFFKAWQEYNRTPPETHEGSAELEKLTMIMTYNAANEAWILTQVMIPGRDPDNVNNLDGTGVSPKQAQNTSVMSIGMIGLGFAMKGLSTIKYVEEVPFHGTGPIKGTMEISSEAQSFKKALSSKEIVLDFAYDSKTNRMLIHQTTDPANGGHTVLVRALGTSEDAALGGRLQFTNDGKLITSEWSGHFGTNWTDESRTQFQKFIDDMLDIDHTHKSGAVQPTID